MTSTITDERPDGVEYFFGWEHENEPDNIRALALKLAIERGGQTCPVCEYDFIHAREIVTGEVKEIDRLRRELASSKAEILAAREALRPRRGYWRADILPGKPPTGPVEAIWVDDPNSPFVRDLAEHVAPTPPTVNSGDGTK